MDDELLKAADTAIEEMEDLLKATEESEDEIEDLAKSDDDDEDDEDDDEDEDEDEDEDDDDIKKSLEDLDSLEDEDGDQFVDAVPVLKSIVESDKKDRKLIKSLEIEVSILNSKIDGLVDMVKSFGKLSVEQAKMIKSMSSAPVSTVIKGQAAPAALFKSQDGSKDVTPRQISALLLKGFKDKELDRDAIVKFEQQGRLTSEAEAYLAKSMAG